MPRQPGAIQVTDRLERRIRKPIDLLRCTTSFIEIVILAVAAVATTTGVETDLTGASARLPHALLTVAPPLALFALLILPIALAVRQVVRRQVQRLAEAVATGVLAGVVAAVANTVLLRSFAERLYDATIFGLSGRPGWRNALSLAVGVYALVHLAALDTTVLSFLITLLVGRSIGLGVRYVAGSPSLRS